MSSSSIDLGPTTRFFRRQKLGLTVVLSVLLLASLASGVLTDFRLSKALTAVPRVVVWVLNNSVPDARSLSRLPQILAKLADTVLMSVAASVAAGAVALLLALAGSRTTRIHGVFTLVCRGVASVARNIPVVAWALVFLITFGQSSFTGALALFFVTFGFLTRAFLETIDEASARSVEALPASGASRPQVIVQAVLPSSLPQMLSWLLFMIETNIRTAEDLHPAAADALYLRRYGGDRFEAESAGLDPGAINPLAAQVLAEEGIDITGKKTNSAFDFYRQGRLYRYVIAVCSKDAADRCPIFPGVGMERLHWPFDDPATVTGTPEEKLHGVREIRDQIKAKVLEFVHSHTPV